MVSTNNVIKALRGDKNLLLIFSKDAFNELDITNQDLLEFQIRNNELVIRKIDLEKTAKGHDMGDWVYDA
jgi:hypothetical protein